MRRVNRLRTLDFRHAVMPFVLAALALRALIPAGFMPASADGFAFTAMLCAPLASIEGRVETQRFELPAPAPHAQLHCDFCLSSMPGAPTVAAGAALPALAASAAAPPFSEQVSTSAPDRAPSARAPPA